MQVKAEKFTEHSNESRQNLPDMQDITGRMQKNAGAFLGKTVPKSGNFCKKRR